MNYPVLRLNTAVVKANINKMATKARDLNIEFRPHFKTHQSHEIGQWFKEYGVTGITVSSLTMAEYFAKDDWDDITVAFPISILDMKRINNLAKNTDLKMLVNSVDVVSSLNEQLHSKLSVYIEIDPNYGRSGVNLDDIEVIESILSGIKESKYLIFAGFYAHAGHSYKCSSKDEVESLTDPLLVALSKLKMKFGGKLCWGDTPSCSILNIFENIDQICPGNFVFYDWMQYQIGSCLKDEIAVRVQCPVIAKFEDRQELLIHGGAVHFSKDYVLNQDGAKNFGQVINLKNVTDNSMYLKSVSQEHGIVSCSSTFFDSVHIGDIIEIFPIHSCLTANLMQAYVSEDGDIIDHVASGAPFNG